MLLNRALGRGPYGARHLSGTKLQERSRLRIRCNIAYMYYVYIKFQCTVTSQFVLFHPCKIIANHFGSLLLHEVNEMVRPRANFWFTIIVWGI